MLTATARGENRGTAAVRRRWQPAFPSRWHDVFRRGRIGELAIGRAEIALKEDGTRIELVPISRHPDEAGLVGAAHLLPPQFLKGHNAILAVDIGGSNIRPGLVRTGSKKTPRLAKARVIRSKHWRHAEDAPGRKEAVERLTSMPRSLTAFAEKDGLALALRSSASAVPE